MRYQVILDNDKYVVAIRHTGNPLFDFVELNLSEYDLEGLKLNAYKLGKDKLIFDEDRYNDLLNRQTQKNNKKEIADLKQKLTDSDYIVARAFEEVMALTNPLTWITDVIKITLKYSQKYREVIANRKAWRKRNCRTGRSKQATCFKGCFPGI